MKQTVVGLFSKQSEAQEAVQQLISKGFSNSNIDLSAGSTGSSTTSTDTGYDTSTGSKDFNLDTDQQHESGVTKFFKNLFGSDDSTDVNRYSTAASRGDSIVTVHADSADEAERAADILDSYGAVNVDEDADGYNSTTGAAPVGAFNETTGTSVNTVGMGDTTTGTYDTGNKKDFVSDDVNDKTSISVIEEELQVGKRTVETGGVRLRSRIIERPVEESLRLKEERVYVNRNPVNRTATSADFDAFKEGEIELREHAEVPVVSKEARIVEEVSLGKEMNERNETVRDTVRKTEVDVENISGSEKSTDTTWKEGSKGNN